MKRKELIEELLKDGNDETEVLDNYDGDDFSIGSTSFDVETNTVRLNVYVKN